MLARSVRAAGEGGGGGTLAGATGASGARLPFNLGVARRLDRFGWTSSSAAGGTAAAGVLTGGTAAGLAGVDDSEVPGLRLGGPEDAGRGSSLTAGRGSTVAA